MQPDWYEIRIRGTLSPEWTEFFDDMEIRQEGEEQTLLSGPMDQAALHGILARIRDLNFPLLAVNAITPIEPPSARPESRGE